MSGPSRLAGSRLLVAAGVALFLAACRDRYFVMPTTGMEPTIKRGERIHVVPLGNHPLARGDVVVFTKRGKPKEFFARRIVALGGDRVAIRSKQLFVNGRKMDEAYAVHNDPTVFEEKDADNVFAKVLVRDQMAERSVREGCVFLLGDNRDNSLDSRFEGDVPVNNVVGLVRLER